MIFSTLSLASSQQTVCEVLGKVVLSQNGLSISVDEVLIKKQNLTENDNSMSGKLFKDEKLALYYSVSKYSYDDSINIFVNRQNATDNTNLKGFLPQDNFSALVLESPVRSLGIKFKGHPLIGLKFKCKNESN